jgi:tyrosyl-DNA phosphodiesterase-1
MSERAQLEKDRRERQKRLRPQASSSYTAAPDDDDDLEEPPAKRHQVSCSNSSFKRSNIPHDSSKKSRELPTIEQVFWNGELRQTATQNAEPRKDGQATIRLTDVLGKVKFFVFDPYFPSQFQLNFWKKAELEFAIVSSYSLDWSWIYEFFDRSVPVIMLAQPDASGEASIKNVLPNWIRTTPFLRAGNGCQHMKVSFDLCRLLDHHWMTCSAVHAGKASFSFILWPFLTILVLNSCFIRRGDYAL